MDAAQWAAHQTHIMMISDPEYLSEPLIKSTEYQHAPTSPAIGVAYTNLV